jgi:hypothetical protein
MTIVMRVLRDATSVRLCAAAQSLNLFEQATHGCVSPLPLLSDTAVAAGAGACGCKTANDSKI